MQLTYQDVQTQPVWTNGDRRHPCGYAIIWNRPLNEGCYRYVHVTPNERHELSVSEVNTIKSIEDILCQLRTFDRLSAPWRPDRDNDSYLLALAEAYKRGPIKPQRHTWLINIIQWTLNKFK